MSNVYVEFKNAEGKVEHIVMVQGDSYDTREDIIERAVIALLGVYDTNIISKEKAFNTAKKNNLKITDQVGEIVE